MDFSDITPVILAAGRGTRMQSSLPKILHRVGNKPLIRHVYDLLVRVLPQTPIIVTLNHPRIISYLEKLTSRTVFQSEPKGNAKSLEISLKTINPQTDFIFVINSDDSFLYRPKTIRDFVSVHLSGKYDLSFITCIPIRPYSGIRKVIRDPIGNFSHLENTKSVREILCGCYIFRRDWLESNLPRLLPSVVNQEYQIVDLLSAAVNQKLKILIYQLPDPSQWWGINTPDDLKYAQELWMQKNPQP